MASEINTKRIKARKYMGDDAYSWAVFLDGRPTYTGLTQREVAHYKRLVQELLYKQASENSD